MQISSTKTPKAKAQQNKSGQAKKTESTGTIDRYTPSSSNEGFVVQDGQPGGRVCFDYDEAMRARQSYWSSNPVITPEPPKRTPTYTPRPADEGFVVQDGTPGGRVCYDYDDAMRAAQSRWTSRY